MNWYIKAWKQYVDFKGRARRKEYWMFQLFNTIILLIALLLDNSIGLTIENENIGAFYLSYAVAIVLPSLAVTVRRLHDVGKSGMMIFIAIIPLIGSIWLFILYLTEGDAGINEYGMNPKEVDM